ncbi:hypothetical protein [Indioceanicola profundi]|uniref:hypothetical protein n=1 Tax=Indioceanicola profundi TaxID=2220096 RepID=UPI000E6AD8AD|nr:hypothetical protein [Indioceanicola profundi]
MADLIISQRRRFSILFSLAIFFSLFPYMRLVPLAIDTQPTALVFSALAFLFQPHHKLPAAIYLLLVLFACAAFLMLFSGVDFSSIRSLLGYLTILFTAYIFYLSARDDLDRFQSLLNFAIVVWLSVGLIQTLFARDFLTWTISDWRTTDQRGVTSLAPEPTFYGTQALFFMIMQIIVRPRLWQITACAVSIVAFAASSQILLVIVIALCIVFPTLLTSRSGRKAAFVLLLVMAAGAALAVDLLEGSRLVSLATLLLEDPTALVLVDQSGNDRFASIFVSLMSAYQNALLPHGLSGSVFQSKFVEMKILFPELLWFAPPTTTIMSGIGRMFFEIGAAAFLFVFLMLYLFRRSTIELRWRCFVFAAFGGVLFTAIPLNHPLVGGILGLLIWRANRQQASSASSMVLTPRIATTS